MRSRGILWNQHNSALQALQLSLSLCLCRGLSCHPPYRSVCCNIKYHHTLEDIVWQFCQGSLEYFFLIARAMVGRKWLPREFLTACFLLMGKNNLEINGPVLVLLVVPVVLLKTFKRLTHGGVWRLHGWVLSLEISTYGGIQVIFSNVEKSLSLVVISPHPTSECAVLILICI